MMPHRPQRLCHHVPLSAFLVLSAIVAWQPWYAQEPTVPRKQVGAAAPEDDESAAGVIPEQEPMSPREELFLAIELRDVAGARTALERGADSQISQGNPSPLATAALHDDLRMVVLLLDAGGDPRTTRDSPLEEAVRNENARMVELLMRAGAGVPKGAPGQELFRLAQRGSAATELSGILLDHGADVGQCLAAATAQARVELMKYCLSRGADVGGLPVAVNPLGVALASDDSEIVDLVLASEPADPILIGAFTQAIAAGRTDLVERALAAGATPAFEHVEAAIENSQPAIALLLLDQSASGDGSEQLVGDVKSLIQRASDLGFDEVAVALRRRSGLSPWAQASWLPLLLAAVVAAGLILFLIVRLGRRRKTSMAAVSGLEMPVRQGRPNSGPRAAPQPRAEARPMPPAAARPAPPAAGQIAPTERLIDEPTDAGVSPAATLPVGAIPMMPSVAQDLSPRAATPGAISAEPQAAPAASSVWQVAPEPVAAPEVVSPDRVIGATASRPEPVVELRMPDVDLSRDAEAVFTAARAASSGETVRPDAPDRRQVVLVAPSRVTMLRSCPAPGSLAPEQLVAAERLAGTSPAKNIAAIAYTDLDAMSDAISQAIPFFDLLGRLGYLGHAVWIFEGHVSAMAAGCRDADVLIVDDGMMPYLPGNWRSVASRSMRGADIHVFERKTGALRRLA